MGSQFCAAMIPPGRVVFEKFDMAVVAEKVLRGVDIIAVAIKSDCVIPTNYVMSLTRIGTSYDCTTYRTMDVSYDCTMYRTMEDHDICGRVQRGRCLNCFLSKR